MSEPQLTVVIPTANRPADCVDAAASVRNAALACELAIELIVVEQSDTPTYEIPDWFDGCWVHTTRRSVSHARNIGLDHARADHVIFLDDDARLLHEVARSLAIHCEADNAVTLTQVDYHGRELPQRQRKAAEIGPTNLFHYFLEPGAIWNVGEVRSAGGFDERIGLPLTFAAEEGAELIGRLADPAAGSITFVPHLMVSHPAVTSPTPEKAEAYGAGAGSHTIAMDHHLRHHDLPAPERWSGRRHDPQRLGQAARAIPLASRLGARRRPGPASPASAEASRTTCRRPARRSPAHRPLIAVGLRFTTVGS